MFSEAELRAYVARSRAAQGLPPTITDPGVLSRIAEILRGHNGSDQKVKNSGLGGEVEK